MSSTFIHTCLIMVNTKQQAGALSCSTAGLQHVKQVGPACNGHVSETSPQGRPDRTLAMPGNLGSKTLLIDRNDLNWALIRCPHSKGYMIIVIYHNYHQPSILFILSIFIDVELASSFVLMNFYQVYELWTSLISSEPSFLLIE